MIHITINAEGSTVAEALANARITAIVPRPGSTLILDGLARSIQRGDHVIGTLAATADTDDDKIAHYTGKDHIGAEHSFKGDDFHYDTKHQSYIDAEHDIDITVPPWGGGAVS